VKQQEEAFLKAIREQPADDAVRLIYADWLDENGQLERAEFIRLQCRLAKAEPWAAERAELEEREEGLLFEHGEEWRRCLPRWLRREKCEFRRGFIAVLQTYVERFLAHGAALRRVTPLEGVRLHGASRALVALVASPSLEGLTLLDLGGEALYTSGAEVLARSPCLASLATLGLDYAHVGIDGARALAHSPHLANLRTLSTWPTTPSALKGSGRWPHRLSPLGWLR
jgi:uncharacterized protein (TIGR02996 family)